MESYGFEIFAKDEAATTITKVSQAVRKAAVELEAAQLRVAKANRAAGDAVEKYGRDSLQAREASNRLERAELAAGEAARKLAAAHKSTAETTRASARESERASSKMASGVMGAKEGFSQAAIAVAGFAGAVAGAVRVMNEGLAGGLTKANAQVALGAKGFADLSAAAQTSAHSLGMTTTEYIGSAGQAAILAKNMGFAQGTATMFGQMLPDLANRISVLSSGQRSAAEASDVLRSALAGEFDPLQAVGINISANIVQQKALAVQQRLGTSVTQQQANALAILSIVSEQTASATDVLSTAQGKAYIEAQQNTAALSEQWGQFEQSVAPAIAKSIGAVNDWIAAVKQLGETQNKSNTGMEAIKNWGNVLVPTTNLIDRMFGKAKDSADAATPSVKELTSSIQGSGSSASSAATDIYALSKAMDQSRDSADKATSAALANRDAHRAYQQAIDDASAAVKDNGHTLDINTEAGRKNSAALDSVASAANRQAQAILDAGGSEAEYRASLQASQKQLIATAMKFGMSRAQAYAYAMQVLAIPAVATTRVQMLGIKSALVGLDTLANRIAWVNGKRVTIQIAANAPNVRESRGSHGGWVSRAIGGWVPGQASNVDSVPAMLAPGEFVVSSGPAQRNRGVLEAINDGRVKGYAAGGMVGYVSGSHLTPAAVAYNISVENRGWIGSQAALEQWFAQTLSSLDRTRGWGLGVS